MLVANNSHQCNLHIAHGPRGCSGFYQAYTSVTYLLTPISISLTKAILQVQKAQDCRHVKFQTLSAGYTIYPDTCCFMHGSPKENRLECMGKNSKFFWQGSTAPTQNPHPQGGASPHPLCTLILLLTLLSVNTIVWERHLLRLLTTVGRNR